MTQHDHVREALPSLAHAIALVQVAGWHASCRGPISWASGRPCAAATLSLRPGPTYRGTSLRQRAAAAASATRSLGLVAQRG